MKYVDYVKVKDDGRQYVIGGSYFTYKGVQYGRGTRIKFTWDFEQRFLQHTLSKNKYWNPDSDWRIGSKYYYPGPWKFWEIHYCRGIENWVCGYLAGTGMKINPDTDIDHIENPIYYVELPTPRELARQRFQDGTWVNCIFNKMLPGYVFFMLIAIIAHPAQRWSTWIVATMWFVIYTYLVICGKEE